MTSRREFVKFGVAGGFVGVAGCINPEMNNNPSDNETDSSGDESDNNGMPEDDTGNLPDDGSADEPENDTESSPNDSMDDENARDLGNDTITLDNEGFSAWVVTELEDTDVDVEQQVSNPEIELTEGTRYIFENNGGSAHPLGFRDEEGNALLSQSNTGEFEDSDSVNWTDEGDFVEFTLTSELADRMSEYYCTVHPQMVGNIVVA